MRARSPRARSCRTTARPAQRDRIDVPDVAMKRRVTSRSRHARRVEAVIHARRQPQRHVSAVAMLVDEARSPAGQQRIGRTLDLKQLVSSIRPWAPTMPSKGWRRIGLGSDRARTGLQRAREAIVQALETRLRRFLEPKIAGEQSPKPERESADEPILDAAETSHQQRRGAARQAIRDKEVDALVLRRAREPSPRRIVGRRYCFCLHELFVTDTSIERRTAHIVRHDLFQEIAQSSNRSRMLRAPFDSTLVWRTTHSGIATATET